MRPHASEARQAVLVLRQFDLQRALFRPRVLRENVEDERSTVEHLDVIAAERLFNLALLVRVQFIVEDQNVKRSVRARGENLAQLAFADECGGVDALDMLYRTPDNGETRRFRESFEFVERVLNWKVVARPL